MSSFLGEGNSKDFIMQIASWFYEARGGGYGEGVTDDLIANNQKILGWLMKIASLVKFETAVRS